MIWWEWVPDVVVVLLSAGLVIDGVIWTLHGRRRKRKP
jgi:hypothetical protein